VVRGWLSLVKHSIVAIRGVLTRATNFEVHLNPDCITTKAQRAQSRLTLCNNLMPKILQKQNANSNLASRFFLCVLRVFVVIEI
jgi:hypothetical protein